MRNLLFIILMFSFATSFSQNGRNFGEISEGIFENDLDYELYQCFKDSASKSATSQCGCYVKSSEQWLVEVNKYNKLILEKLENKAEADFIASNEAWIKYRYAEVESAYSIYRDTEQRIDMYHYHERLVELNRERALVLKRYCDHLNIKYKN